jgi:predicted ATPase
VGEGHAWVERAIRSLDEAGLRNTRQEMMLQAALGISFQLVRAVTSEAHAALTRALELADHLGDPDYQRHIIHTFWIYHTRIGEVRSSLALARRAEAIASSMTDTTASAEAAWMLGIALYFAGESEVARQHLEHLLQDPPPGYRSFSIRRTGFDQCIPARYILGHALWVQGSPAQAMDAIRTSLEEARHLQHPLTLCSALGLGGCPLALRTGDLETARRWAEELVACAEQHAFGDYLSYGMAVQEIVSLRKAGSQANSEQARVALQRWRAAQWHVVLSVIDFAEAAAHAGHAGEISALADEALERAERNQELWAFPEALRVKGELLLLQDAPDPQLARQYFLRSLKQARAQGALSWELRTAMSIARLELGLGSPDQARDVLSRAYARFREGFDTADLKAARQLLGALNYTVLESN